MDINPRDVINEARQAVTDKDYVVALEKYKWFFDNSIKINSSFRGVRLSYCLHEWAELGNEFPVAKQALIKQKEIALKNFLDTFSYHDFHEYSSIAGYLKNSDEVFQEFLKIRESNPLLAEDIFTDVYEYCAINNIWDLCKQYLVDGQSQYDRSLELFDHMINFSKETDADASESLLNSACENLEKEMLWILTMLSHTNSPFECSAIQSKLESDLSTRGFIDFYLKILASSPKF